MKVAKLPALPDIMVIEEYDLVEFDIILKPGAKPVKHKYKPPSPTVAPDLDRQIDNWIKQHVIEETDPAERIHTCKHQLQHWKQQQQ